ncbi:MAG: alpha/beta fold hydrolase [Pseudomonadota bacterium]
MKTLLRLLALFCMAAAAQAAPSLSTEEFMVPSTSPGISLYVRNKHATGVQDFSGDRIVLYVHGATYPAEGHFDLPLDGMSWMDYIAARGYDVYLVDIRGYGRSTRPAEMSQPPDQNAPLVRTEMAVRDVGSAVDFILKRRGAAKINLVGWSWGTTIMGWYTAQNNAKVNKLVLYAPSWLTNSPSLADPGGKLGAWRAVTREVAKARWLTGVPEAKKAGLIPAGWYEQWAEANFASDPEGAKMTPPVLRAPNGILLDKREYWSAGKALYDPGEIRVATFLAHAEWDADLPSYMLYAYFARLTSTPYKRYVEIGEGTHNVMLEKNRLQLFDAVQQFLDERR